MGAGFSMGGITSRHCAEYWIEREGKSNCKGKGLWPRAELFYIYLYVGSRIGFVQTIR